MWGGGSSPPTTYHIPPIVYHLQDTNYLCFQQHSRHERLTIFVFCNIPAFLPPVENRPFIFTDIPASLLIFLKLLQFLHSLSW
jgi:hypothetical protein